LLLGVDSVWLEAECARYEFFFDVIHQSSPDVVIVSLDADRNKALQLISQLASEFPEMPVLAVSSDDKAILQALHRGAKFFLTQPVVLEELLVLGRPARCDVGRAIGTRGHGCCAGRQDYGHVYHRFQESGAPGQW
jgi:pilus assembly protein CpaE